MKKIIALFLAVLTIAACFTGCGEKAPAETPDVQEENVPAEETAPEEEAEASDDKETDAITLTWAVYETDNLTADYWQYMIDAFEADNPGIKIEKVLMTGDSRPQFLKTMMAAGNMPDINIDPIDLANVEGVYAEVPEDLLSQFDPSTVVSFNGKKNLVPAATALRAQVYYNKAMFAEAGIDSFPTTLDGFKEACQKLLDAGFVPMITGGAKDIWATDFAYFTCALNSEVYTAYPEFNKDLKEGKVDFANPAVIDCMQYWQDLINAGYFHKGSMSFGYSQASNEFLNGGAAIMLDGAWIAPGIDNGDNDYAKENIGVACFPTTEKNYCTMPSYWAVAESCENKEAAFKFCAYCLGGNKDVYQHYLMPDGLMSVTKEPITYEHGPLTEQFIANLEGYELVPDKT